MQMRWIFLKPGFHTIVSVATIVLFLWKKNFSTNTQCFHMALGPHSQTLRTGREKVRPSLMFYTPKHPNFKNLSYQKNLTSYSIPKKTRQCFCIDKFYYLSSKSDPKKLSDSIISHTKKISYDQSGLKTKKI